MSPLDSIGYSSQENEISLDSLKIEGKIPHEINGILVRNGPAKFEVGVKKLQWLDGLAMLHSFIIREGKVSYINRFLRTNYYKKVMHEKKMPYRMYVSDPCRSLFKSFFSFFYSIKDLKLLAQNTNVNVAKIGDHFIATTEVPLSVEFDPETLETIGTFTYQDSLCQSLRFETVHPHYDLKKNESLNYYTQFGKKSSYNLFSIPQNSVSRKLIVSLEAKKPSYMHTFSITEKFLILVEYPFRISPLSLVLKRKPFIYNYVWRPEDKTHFLVVDREKGSLVGEYECEAFFSFHHINAYETEGGLILDLVGYKDPSIIFQPDPLFYRDKEIIRFQISFNNKKVKMLDIISSPLELPRLHYESSNGKPYRYVYGVSAAGDLLKVDMKSGKTIGWRQHACFAGEPTFISNGSEEDHGFILSIILDATQKTSFLVILDAKTFTPIGKAFVPQHIPFALHGNFYDLNRARTEHN